MALFETTQYLLVALGKSIIHSIWIGLVILAILKMVLLGIPQGLARLRYTVSVLSLLLLTGVILGSFLLLYSPDMQVERNSQIIESLRNTSKIILWDSTVQADWRFNLFYTLCSYLYLVGMGFMLLHSVSSHRYVRRLRKSGSSVSPDWQLRLRRVSDSLGIKRKLGFLESPQINGPILIGILKPVIMVPVGMLTHLSVSQVEAILIHELYHLKRMDYLVNILQLCMERMLFYHPVVWVISDQIRREREHCCDDAVVQICRDPVDYAKALVHLAEQPHYIRLVPGAGGSNKKHFVTRISRILNRNNMKKNRKERILSPLLFLGAMCVVVAITGFSSGISMMVPAERVTEIPVTSVEPGPAISLPLMQDTIRKPEKQAAPEELDKATMDQIREEVEKARREMEEIDWDQIKADMEAARKEAMEDIDWDQIKEDMEAARKEAMEDIDWDQMKADIEAARKEAMEDIDWDQIKADMEAARKEAMEDIDWDQMKEDIEKAKQDMKEIDWDQIREEMEKAKQEMKEIDWEEMKVEVERSISEMKIDMEQMKKDIKESLDEIDWDEIRKNMEDSMHELELRHDEQDM